MTPHWNPRPLHPQACALSTEPRSWSLFPLSVCQTHPCCPPQPAPTPQEAPGASNCAGDKGAHATLRWWGAASWWAPGSSESPCPDSAGRMGAGGGAKSGGGLRRRRRGLSWVERFPPPTHPATHSARPPKAGWDWLQNCCSSSEPQPKPTAPGIPRRSPIQVLTRPDPA